MKLSRRTTLAMLGGGALAIGAGVTFVATMSDEDLVHAVLEKHLGRIEMAREDIAAFLLDFCDRQPWLFPPAKLAMVYGTATRLDLADITRAHLPGGRGADLARFERHLLGDFHMRTDIAFRTSAEDPIHYLGAGACLNPFAKFV